MQCVYINKHYDLFILFFTIDSGKVSRISPKNMNSSWDVLALDNDNIIAGR